jgi:pyrophosphatase PpaX
MPRVPRFSPPGFLTSRLPTGLGLSRSSSYSFAREKLRYVDRMRPPSTVLFDLDGTLIDSVDLIIDSYHHTFRHHGLALTSREELIEGIGTPLVAVFGRMTDQRSEIDSWIATYREFNLAHHDTRVRAFPGVVEMVQRIHRGGRQLGVVTSKNNAGARRGLKLIGIEELIAVVVGADDVRRHKPDPEPVEQALTKLGVAATDAIFIGDSHHDVASGKAAGVRTLAVCWGPIARERLALAEPDYLCGSIEEVLVALGA